MRFIKNALPCNETGRSVGRHYALGCLAFAFLSLSACSGQNGETSETVGKDPQPSTELAATASPLLASAEWSDQQDVSGYVHIRQTRCDWVGPSSNPTAACGIGGADWDDYALIGGGAEVEDVPHGASALLTESKAVKPNGVPGNDATVYRNWEARSKDQIISYPHRLRAYSIGLKLTGISGASLRAYIHFTEVTSPSSVSTPTAFAPPAAGDSVLLGGGARTIYGGAGQLLINSYPYKSGGVWGWKADSKDHGTSDPGVVLAQAISMGGQPWGQNASGIDARIFGKVGATVPTGFAYMTTAGPIPAAADLRMNEQRLSGSVDFGWVLTGIGAHHYNTAGGTNGRLLNDLYPFGWDRGSIQVTNKDHGSVQAGAIEAWILGIARL